MFRSVIMLVLCLALFGLGWSLSLQASVLVAEESSVPNDPVTNFPEQSVAIGQWPDGKKVAVCFVFYVETWESGHGPAYRPDMVDRKPDLVNEYYRQYGIKEGIVRVAKLFRSQDVPLSIALNAQFPEKHPEVWKGLRSTAPDAVIVAHGMNNSSDQLPLGEGLDAQRRYIRQTLDLIEKATGSRVEGWSSPSVEANISTYTATAAEGIRYSLDAMDSDDLYILTTPSGPLMMVPYPVITVDMGQVLARLQSPSQLEVLWTDYISQLVKEARDDPGESAAVVAIGIHPFVCGTPAGAAVLDRVLSWLKQQETVWLADVQAVYNYASDQ